MKHGIALLLQTSLVGIGINTQIKNKKKMVGEKLTSWVWFNLP
jgi:hypothetical protein